METRAVRFGLFQESGPRAAPLRRLRARSRGGEGEEGG